MRTYKIISKEEAGTDEIYPYDNDEWGYCVVCQDGDRTPVWIGEDGGEPEDQLLSRDWGWVAVALNAAYKKGREDAMVEHEEQTSACCYDSL